MKKYSLLVLLILLLTTKTFAQKDTITREQGWSFGVCFSDIVLNSTGYLDEIPFASGPLESFRESNFGFNIMLKVPLFEDENITQKSYSDYFLELKRNTLDLYFRLGYHNLNYNFIRRDKELFGGEDFPAEAEIETKFNILKDIFYFESGLSYNTNFNLEFFGGIRIDYSSSSELEYRETIIRPYDLSFTNGLRTRTFDLEGYLTDNKYNLNLIVGAGYEIYPSYLFNLSILPQIYFGIKVLPEFKEAHWHFYYANFGLAIVFHNDKITIPIYE
ncbi:MAG: hypothetical protein V1779_04465 [bacterium]